MAWSIRRRSTRSRASILDLTAVPAPNEAAAAQYYPAIYWYSMLKIPAAGQFGGKSDIPEKLTQTDWLKQMKNIGCIGCHQLGQDVDPHDPGGVRRVQVRRGGLDAARSVRPVRRADDQPACRQFRRRAVQVFRRVDRPHRQGRAAARPSRRGRKASSATSSSRPGSGRHRKALPARSDLVGPAQSDRQCLRPALRLARICDRQHADPRSEDATR